MISENLFDPAMPLNHPGRHRHDCSNKTDRPLIVTRTPKGWKWYCHRCGEKGFRSIANLSPAEFKKWREQPVAERQVAEQVELPRDFTREIPPEGMAWLHKAGLTREDIQTIRAGYSSVMHRVILPVYKDGELVYWQGRGLQGPFEPGRNPKYMNVKARGRKDVYFIYRPAAADEDRAVLVEDILSAVRVGRALGVTTYALLYAYVPNDLILKLSKRYIRIIVWLDPDKSGYMARMVNKWRSFGIDLVAVYTDKDPKEYTDDQIIETIEGE